MKVLALCTCLLATVWMSSAVTDYQLWSIITRLGVDVELTCNDTYPYPTATVVETGDTLQWRKHDSGDGPIVNSTNHELLEAYGFENMILKLKAISEADSGVYMCDVINSTQHLKGTIIKGLNLGTYKYDDAIDEYREKIVVGIIAGACVMVFLVGIGLIDNYRYLSPEQKQKRKDREMASKQRSRGQENFGADLDMTEGVNGRPMENGDQKQSNTHL